MEALTLFTPGSEGLLMPLRPYLDDPLVNEILINKPGEVFIDRQGVMTSVSCPLLNARHLHRLFVFIANENGQVLNEMNPVLSGSLKDGSRVQLVIPPAAGYATLSIRRPSVKKLSLEDYRSSSFYDKARAFDLNSEHTNGLNAEKNELGLLYTQRQWADFIEKAIVFKKNILISGATSSGKTTFLNACTAFIPGHERIITLEDTYEINIPHKNVVNLLAPKKTEGQKTLLSMQDLVQCALRLRPDRLIMGEIRGREILDFISACSTGHEGSITSLHANNPRMAFMRMTQLYKQNNVPSMRDEDIYQELHAVIDIIVQVIKTPHGRCVSDIYYKEAPGAFGLESGKPETERNTLSLAF